MLRDVVALGTVGSLPVSRLEAKTALAWPGMCFLSDFFASLAAESVEHCPAIERVLDTDCPHRGYGRRY